MTRRVGVEISSTAVRMAALSLSDSRRRLVAYAEVELANGAVVDGGIVDRQVVSSAIASCIAKGGFNRALSTGPLRARVSVGGLRAITRDVEMPPVPDAELDSAARLQALDVIPFPIEETLLSARVIGPASASTDAVPTGGSADAAKARVLLAAAHRELVEPIVDVLSEAGIVVEGVELAPSALMRSLASVSGVPGVPEALVAIGAELTTVVVHEGGELCFVRTIAGGGNAVTGAIARALDLPSPDAEALKRRLTLLQAAGPRVPPEAVAAARDSSATLLAAICSSLEYYASLPGRSEVGRVVLTGGGARLDGLVERLQRQMRARVEFGDCLSRVEARRFDADAERLRATAAVVIGLALREPAGRKALDLLPPEYVVHRRQRRIARAVAVAAGVAVVAFAASGVLRYHEVHTAEIGVGSLNGTIAQLERQIPRYDTVAIHHAAILADERIGAPLVSHEVNWPAVLVALGTATPPQVSAAGFTGTVTLPPTTATAGAAANSTVSSGGKAVDGVPSTLPSPTVALGTVSLSLNGPTFLAFQQWFDQIFASPAFEILEYSGVTNSGPSVAFTAQLAITGVVHTSRLGEFEVGS